MTASRILCLSFLALQSLALAAVPTGKPQLLQKIDLPAPDTLTLFSSVDHIKEFVWVASGNQMMILAKNDEHRVVKIHVTGNRKFPVTSRPIGIKNFVYFSVKDEGSTSSELFIVKAKKPHDIVKTLPLAEPWDAVHFGGYAALIEREGKVILIDRRTHEIAQTLSLPQNLKPGLVVNSQLYVPGVSRDLMIISSQDPCMLKTLEVGGTITSNIILHQGLVYAIVNERKLVAIDPESESVTTLSEFEDARNVSAIGNHVFVELCRPTLDHESPHGDVWDSNTAHFAALNLCTGEVESLEGPGYFYAPLNPLGKHVCMRRKIDHNFSRERNFVCVDPDQSLEIVKTFPFSHATIQDGYLFQRGAVSLDEFIRVPVYGSDFELLREISFPGDMHSDFEIIGDYLYVGQWYFASGGLFTKHLSIYDIFGSLAE